MSRPDDAARIQHMLEAARNALRLAEGRTQANLHSDLSLPLALWKLLEIVGEAAARVTPQVRTSYPNVPWQLAVDMRNRLTHGYDTVDYGVIWKTVSEDLPQLVPALEAILADLENV